MSCLLVFIWSQEQMLQLIQTELHIYDSMDQKAHLRTVQYLQKFAKNLFSMNQKKKQEKIKFTAVYLKKSAVYLNNQISLGLEKIHKTNVVLQYQILREHDPQICTCMCNIKFKSIFLFNVQKYCICLNTSVFLLTNEIVTYPFSVKSYRCYGMIYWIVHYAVSAIFQSYNGGVMV